MKKIQYALYMILVIISVAGCAKGDKVKETTLYIEKDGTVTGAIVEKLDKEYYDDGELKKWIEEEVKEYNQQNGSDRLEIEKCEVEKDTAKVTISYQSIQDYSDFNHVHAFCGTVKEAEKAGYEFTGEFTSAKNKPAVSHAELKGSESYYVVILEEPQTVVLDQDILYASANVKVDGKNAIVKTAKKEIAYIIYKP